MFWEISFSLFWALSFMFVKRFSKTFFSLIIQKILENFIPTKNPPKAHQEPPMNKPRINQEPPMNKPRTNQEPIKKQPKANQEPTKSYIVTVDRAAFAVYVVISESWWYWLEMCSPMYFTNLGTQRVILCTKPDFECAHASCPMSMVSRCVKVGL